MSELSSVIMEDGSKTGLQIKLMGRKGFRYLEVGSAMAEPWRLWVDDDVTLSGTVEFEKYQWDSRGDYRNAVVITIDSKKYTIGKQYDVGGWAADTSREFKRADANMRLGYMFDDIREALGCSTDDDAKRVILENDRLIKILSSQSPGMGPVDLARRIDQLNLINDSHVKTIQSLEKDLAITRDNLTEARAVHQEDVSIMTRYRTDYFDFKNKFASAMKTAINAFEADMHSVPDSKPS